jgi:hypothetical protein
VSCAVRRFISLNIKCGFKCFIELSFGAYVYDSTYASLMAGFETPGRSLIKIYKIVGKP